jgi:signal transduction histidine kinase
VTAAPGPPQGEGSACATGPVNNGTVNGEATAARARPEPLVASVVRSILRAPFTRRTWGELLYIAISLPLGVVGSVVVGFGLVLGGSLAITFIGLPVIAATAVLARRTTFVHRGLASALIGERLEAPRPLARGRGFFSWLRSGLRDPAGWRAVAYLLLKLPVALVGAYVVVTLWIYGFLNLTYPLWWELFGSTGHARGAHATAPLTFGAFSVDTLAGSFVLSAIGLAAVLAGPWAVRASVALDRLLLRGLLGSFTLSERIRSLQDSRARAVDDSAAELRRIERDLHDGAQVRLTALAMTLGTIKKVLARDGAAAADLRFTNELVDAAHRNAKDALVELRQLARGIHPPVLDSGLGAALATLAASSPIPVELAVELPERRSPAIETIAYFCVAELLANAAKHSRAHRATVKAGEHRGKLLVTVSDDGVGGAKAGTGGGLAGLADRVRTVDGHIEVNSPHGGPTVVAIELPSHT